MPKCPVRDLKDFAIWYTPGVAAPCKAIQRDPSLVYEYTKDRQAFYEEAQQLMLKTREATQVLSDLR